MQWQVSGHRTLAAVVLTLMMSALLLLPLCLGIRLAIVDALVVANFIARANLEGLALHSTVLRLPFEHEMPAGGTLRWRNPAA